MIITEVFYGVKCNRCGEIYEDGEHSFWSDEQTAVENSLESDWADLGHKHYCTNCHEVDEATEKVKVYDDYPTCIKTLNNFVDKIIKGIYRNLLEYNNHFVIKFRLYHNPTLEDFEVSYIKRLLGDKFISLGYETEKYGSINCIINVSK